MTLKGLSIPLFLSTLHKLCARRKRITALLVIIPLFVLNTLHLISGLLHKYEFAAVLYGVPGSEKGVSFLGKGFKPISAYTLVFQVGLWISDGFLVSLSLSLFAIALIYCFYNRSRGCINSEKENMRSSYQSSS